MISVIAPNSSESLEAMLSTSPVGDLRGSTWPIWAILRVTISMVPYSPINQVRTTRVWKTTPKMPPTTTTTTITPVQPHNAATEPPRIASSTALPKIHGPSVIGRNHSSDVRAETAMTFHCRASSQRRNAAGDRVSGSLLGGVPSPETKVVTRGGKSCIAPQD